MSDRTARSRLEITGLADAVHGRASVRRLRARPRAARGRRAPWSAPPSGPPTPATRRRGASSPSRDAGAARGDEAAPSTKRSTRWRAWPETAGIEKELKALARLRDLLRRAPLVDRRLRQTPTARWRRAATARGAARDERDRLRARPDLQSLGAAVQLLCTAAHAMGYGSCWMTAPRARGAGHRATARGRAAGARWPRSCPSAGRRRRPGPRAPARRGRPRVPVSRRPPAPASRATLCTRLRRVVRPDHPREDREHVTSPGSARALEGDAGRAAAEPCRRRRRGAAGVRRRP